MRRKPSITRRRRGNKTRKHNVRRRTVKKRATITHRRKRVGGGGLIGGSGLIGGAAGGPGMILSPYEQSKIYLYPQDDMRYNNDFLDSRTPFMNVANKIFVTENVNDRLQSRY